MAYDLFILCLAIAGIVSALVFSYKIAHSRVYPIGIVRKVPKSPKSSDGARTEPDTLNEVPPELVEAFSSIDIDLLDMWRCEKCGFIQHCDKDLRCRRCKQAFASPAITQSGNRGEPGANEGERLGVGKQVAEHDETLQLHNRLLANFEERIRRLEVESLQKSQPAGEEAPQPRQAEYFH